MVIWPEHLGSKAFLAGVNLAAFAADYTAITGQPFPAAVPPVPPVAVRPVPGPPDVNPADVALAHSVTAWAYGHRIPPQDRAVAGALRAWLAAKGFPADPITERVPRLRQVCRSAGRRLWSRLGYRGAFLWSIAAFDVFFGWYLAAGGNMQYQLFVSERVWGVVFLSVAAVLLAGGLVRMDAAFFALPAFLKTAWAMEYFRFQFEHPDSLQWTRGAYFLVLALIVLVVSHWPEPS